MSGVGGIDAAALVSLPSATKTARAAPADQLALASARGRLEDWVTCPSAKTPEGQAKIRAIGTQIDAIEARMTAAASHVATASHVAAAPAAPAVYTAAGSAATAVGSRIDVYA